MQYEVEKRSKLSGMAEFSRVKAYLENNAEFLGRKEMKSYLFRKPSYLRIRLIEGKDIALITEKIGKYTDAARQEKEQNIPLANLLAFVKEKNKEGYHECSLVHTTRYSYRLNSLNVELNEIDYLGLIIEVEALTKNKSEIPSLESRIRKTMKELQLKELNPVSYQKMMDSMYSKTLKPASEQTFSF